MKKGIFIILFLVVAGIVQAQLWERVYYVSGKVLDKQTKKPVAYVLIVNIKKGNSTQSDTAGRFLISMTKDDTLRFSSLGYKTAYFSLGGKRYKKKKIDTVIYLEKKVYNLRIEIFKQRNQI